MIVDVLVLSLWKTTLVMIDLATTAQSATATAADFVVGVTIDCPSLTKTQKKGKCGKGEIYIVVPYPIGYCTLYTRRIQTETGNP